MVSPELMKAIHIDRQRDIEQALRERAIRRDEAPPSRADRLSAVPDTAAVKPAVRQPSGDAA